ncbi:MAG: hypothetical protein ACXVX6_03405 [Mycobacterium sp.]
MAGDGTPPESAPRAIGDAGQARLERGSIAHVDSRSDAAQRLRNLIRIQELR